MGQPMVTKTKEPDKSAWEENYNKKSISGIEVRDKNGKLVHFIAIKHDELLEKNSPHRITIKLNENGKPILPPPQTFEEIIQAKRRQQHLLYGSANSASSNATLANRTAARRVAAARAQAVSAATSLSRRSIPSISRRPTTSSGSGSRSRKRPKSKKSGGSRAAVVANPAPKLAALETPAPTPAPTPPTPVPTQPKKVTTPTVEPKQNVEPTPGPSGSQVVTSMKDLTKQNPLFESVDPKEVKLLLKSAPPGASVMLPNGTVIKKSRRGGARAGAGRKRSRPLPSPSHQSSGSFSSRNSQGGSQQPVSSTNSSPQA